MNDTHSIRKQRFRFSVKTREEAEFVYSEISTLAKNGLDDRIEALLTELFPGQKNLRINQLRIDIGDLPQEDFAHTVNLRVTHALRQELTQAKIQRILEESLYIHNAGLVILAPFLNRYFSTLGLLDGDQFKDAEAAARGVLLLEYLASGRTEVPAHELVFNKVLCGLDVAEPVSESIELTETEQDVSQQLLNSVLQNWDKMSNSTVENLQGSFLGRDGLLLEKEEHWSLTVESAGYDILLSYLPWTISTITQPWMSKRLETHWATKTH